MNKHAVRHASLPALLLALVTVSAGPLAPPAVARELTGVPGATAAGDLSVALLLAQTPEHTAALAALAAAAQPAPTSVRVARASAAARTVTLAGLRPALAETTAVTAFAALHGLRLVHTTSASVLLSGPATTVASVFGTTVASNTLGQRYALTPPQIPVALRAVVGSVVGLDERPAMHAQVIPLGLDGTRLRAAYDVSAATSTGAGTTVATVQFSSWDPTDAATYAAAAGITLGPHQITEVAVDNATLHDVNGNSGAGGVEVAMDVEAILAAAPAASQRVYIAPNLNAYAIDLANQVADDAAAGKVQVASSSWGGCEARISAGYRQAVGSAIDRMVAAGATFFAASGDLGAFACSSPSAPDNTLAVEFPASYPNAVGVGGTVLDTTADPTTERGWGLMVFRPTVFAGYGSGGGLSTAYAQPAYQATLGLPSTGRMVPDVAAVADAASGLSIYCGYAGGWGGGGGTSLSAPLWAGFTAAALSSAGRTTGPGNILPTLYANPRAFRDVMNGYNGGYPATPGYDLVTGLGTPDWGALAPLLTGMPLTPTAPTPVITSSASPTPAPVVVAGGARQQPYLGDPFVLTGTGPAGSTVTLHFHTAGTPAGDFSLLRTVTVGADGSWSRAIVADRDYSYYATAGTAPAGAPSGTVVLTPLPTVLGPLRRVIARNTPHTLTGRAVPGSTVFLHFTPLTTGLPAPASTVRTLVVPASGTWSRTYLAALGYSLFVSRDAGPLPGARTYALPTT